MDRAIALVKVGDPEPIAAKVRVAGSFLARFRGLMGKRHLPADQGLYLPVTNSIHMLFMRFPIDALFVGESSADGSRPVLGVRHALPPWRGVVWYVRGAKGVVELPAGKLAEVGVSVGDHVQLVDAVETRT